VIGQHLGRAVGRHDHDLDVLPDEARQDRGDAGHQGLEVDGLRLEELLAAEREGLAGQPGGPLRGRLDQVDVLSRGIVRGEPHKEEGDAASDHGQQVVEVVGDAARELADRLHLLGLGELGLGLLQLRVRGLQPLDEPGVAESDRELVRHVARDADLLVGEGLLVAAEAHRADELARRDHRHHHGCR
jgi:hypothetical protein